MRRVVVRNENQDAELAQAEWRGSIIGRARGLLGRARLDEGDGIVIAPCNSVHMLFMRFGIDVLYLDKEGAVVKAVHNLRPYRFSMGGRRAHLTVELARGTLERTGTSAGDRISFHEAA